MSAEFGNYKSFYSSLIYYYNYLNNLIFVSNLFKSSNVWVQKYNENKSDVKSKI